MARGLVAAMNAALLLAACGPGPGPGEPGEPCKDDGDCGDLTCTRDRVCQPDDQIRVVQLRWTLRGQSAGTTSCDGVASIELALTGPGASFRIQDIICSLGLFTIDKLSLRFDRVELTGVASSGRPVVRAEAALTADEVVQLDLLEL